MQPTPADHADALLPPGPAPSPEHPAEPLPNPYAHHRYTQWVLLAAAAGAFAAFWWVAKLLNIPSHPGYNGSLLKQPVGGALVGVFTAAVLVLATTAVVTRLARRHWVYAGALAASVGLAAWSFRGGPSWYVLIAPTPGASGTGVFLGLAVEMLVLGLIVGAAWLVVLPRFAGGPPTPGPLGPTSLTVPAAPDPMRSLKPDAAILTAVLAQAAFVAVGVALLVPNAEKKQAAFGVLAACFLATAIAQHYFHDERLARWYWAGPVLVGVLGYLLNAFGGGAAEAVETGRLVGSFAALARPLPLDYAGAGVAGALMGYWIGSDHPDAVVTAAVPVSGAEPPDNNATGEPIRSNAAAR